MKNTKEIFIIGSSEGRDHAEYLKVALNEKLVQDPIIDGRYRCVGWWEKDVWKNGRCTLDSLIAKAESLKYNSGFVISLFSPDDFAEIRKEKYCIGRDNVWLEYGLFAGILGQERVFFALPDNGSTFSKPSAPDVVYRLGTDIKFHWPSDVAGMHERAYRFNTPYNAKDTNMILSFRDMIDYIIPYLQRQLQPIPHSSNPESGKEKDWSGPFCGVYT